MTLTPRFPVPAAVLTRSATAFLSRMKPFNGSPVVWIIGLAIFFRGAVGFANLDHFATDPDAYRAIAETLGQRGVYGLTTPSGDVVATAFRPPLYPYLLSWIAGNGSLNLIGVAVLHAILGGLTAGFTYLSCVEWLGSERGRLPGILAASLVIVDPVLIQQSTLVMTETLATAIASLVIWWWVCHLSKRFTLVSAGVLGGWLALAYLCRPTFVVWGVMLIVCLAFSNAPDGVRRGRRILAAAITGMVVVVAIAIWTYRNASMLGHPIWATSHGGYTLLLGNNPLIYRHFREESLIGRWDANPFLVAYAHRYEGDSTSEEFWFRNWESEVRMQPELSATLTEHDDDQLTYRAAKATILRDRGLFLLSCMVRAYKLWTPFPHAIEGRSIWKVLGIGAYYSLLYLSALIGLSRLGRHRRSSVWWPIPTLVLTLTLVHAVYWSNMRMRTPAIPAIAMLAAAAFTKSEPSRK